MTESQSYYLIKGQSHFTVRLSFLLLRVQLFGQLKIVLTPKMADLRKILAYFVSEIILRRNA